MCLCVSANVVQYSESVPYLSPVVLRKEMEMLVEQDGESGLDSCDLVDDHAVIFWNLVCSQSVSLYSSYSQSC